MKPRTDEERHSRLFRTATFWPYKVEHCEFWTEIETITTTKCSPQQAAMALRAIADWIECGGGEGWGND